MLKSIRKPTAETSDAFGAVAATLNSGRKIQLTSNLKQFS